MSGWSIIVSANVAEHSFTRLAIISVFKLRLYLPSFEGYSSSVLNTLSYFAKSAASSAPVIVLKSPSINSPMFEYVCSLDVPLSSILMSFQALCRTSLLEVYVVPTS